MAVAIAAAAAAAATAAAVANIAVAAVAVTTDADKVVAVVMAAVVVVTAHSSPGVKVEFAHLTFCGLRHEIDVFSILVYLHGDRSRCEMPHKVHTHNEIHARGLRGDHARFTVAGTHHRRVLTPWGGWSQQNGPRGCLGRARAPSLAHRGACLAQKA